MKQTHDRMGATIRSLQPVRDEELVESVRTPEAEALFERIVAVDVAETPPAARSVWRRRRSLTALVFASVLMVAGVAGAWLASRDDRASRSDFHVGAAKGPPDPNVAYVNVPIAGTEGRDQLRARFRRLGFDVDVKLVPASPLLEGKILAAGGHGAGEQIRELRQDCPTPAPCGRTGLKVPEDLDGTARIALGGAAQPHEPYVHVWAFQPGDMGVLGLVGHPVDVAERRIKDRAWARANPLWYRLDNGKVQRRLGPIRDFWVVDAIGDGGSDTKPSRIVLAVAPRRESPPKPFWMPGRYKRYQQLAQRFR